MARTSYAVEYGKGSGMNGSASTEEEAEGKAIGYAAYLKAECNQSVNEIAVSCEGCGGDGTIRIANKRRGWSEGKQVRCPVCKGKDSKRVINLVPLAVAGLILVA